MANQFSLGAVLDKFRGTQGADQTTKIASEEGEATEKVAEEEAPKEEKAEKAENRVLDKTFSLYDKAVFDFTRSPSQRRVISSKRF